MYTSSSATRSLGGGNVMLLVSRGSCTTNMLDMRVSSVSAVRKGSHCSDDNNDSDDDDDDDDGDDTIMIMCSHYSHNNDSDDDNDTIIIMCSQ